MAIRNLELRARTVVEGFWHGLHRSPYHGFSVEFTEYRPYSPGDDPRYLDWRLVARLGVSGVLGAILGAWILSNIEIPAARRFVYAYLLLMGLYILWKSIRIALESRAVAGWTSPLGFLAGLKRAEVLERLNEVLAGGFREDRRRRLDVRVSAGPYRGRYRALNDAVLHKEAIARIATFSVWVGA